MSSSERKNFSSTPLCSVTEVCELNEQQLDRTKGTHVSLPHVYVHEALQKRGENLEKWLIQGLTLHLNRGQ